LSVFFTKYYLRDKTKEDEIGTLCNTCAGERKYLMESGWDILRKETTWTI